MQADENVYIRYARLAIYAGKTALGYSAPFIWAPLVTNHVFNEASRTLFVLIIIYVQLLLGTVHPGAASVMVFFYLPFLELNRTGDLDLHYFSEFVFSSFGQLAYTGAFEHSGLARRIALCLMQAFASSTNMAIFGLMFCAMFVSMWIDNATAALAVVPIVNDTFTAIQRNTCRRMNDASLRELVTSSGSGQDDVVISEELEDELFKLERMRQTALIGVGFAATIGNFGYISGHALNYYVIGMIEQDYKYVGVSAKTWFLFHFPLCLVQVIFIWSLLTYLKLGKQVESKQQAFIDGDVRHSVKEQIRGLGPVTTMSTYWVAATVMLFIVPAESVSQCSKRLMTWPFLNGFMPWHTLFLIGTCLTLDIMFRVSGLNALAKAEVQEYVHIHVALVQILITIFTSLVTELCHQSTVIAIVTPYAAHLAVALQVHPIYFVLAVYHAGTMSFMYPGSSVCNEIVYAQAKIKTADMAVPGLILKTTGLILSLVAINTVGYYYFDMEVYPDPTEVTAASTATF
ncbi:Na(+)/dicarboxylate cotransporter 3-like isoform X4 [Ornithodoros turicata]|uniref:Na(+)/dicarboxylate cotransporter 3-like isoform X4 n=1 Tax=Ornithodoros turicata TaxID=34597 RepID=UPI003138E079